MNVLILESDQGTALHLLEAISEYTGFSGVVAQTLCQADAHLKMRTIDVVIMGLNLSGNTITEMFQWIEDTHVNAPILILIDEDSGYAVQAILCGAYGSITEWGIDNQEIINKLISARLSFQNQVDLQHHASGCQQIIHRASGSGAVQ